MEKEKIQPARNSRTIQQRNAQSANIMDNRPDGSRNYLSGHPLQRVEDDEEEDVLQGKLSAPAQRLESEEDDDEVLQGKMAEPVPKNETGLPDNLKAGVESLSGYSLDDVRVHYNSSKPATVQALAYTQGTDIHVAPGQEKHLPHEAWHVAQQMAGRVSPTTNINGMPVNDNAALEHEADVMGEKALQCRGKSGINNQNVDGQIRSQSLQMLSYKTQGERRKGKVKKGEKGTVNTLEDLYAILKGEKVSEIENRPIEESEVNKFLTEYEAIGREDPNVLRNVLIPPEIKTLDGVLQILKNCREKLYSDPAYYSAQLGNMQAFVASKLPGCPSKFINDCVLNVLSGHPGGFIGCFYMGYPVYHISHGVKGQGSCTLLFVNLPLRQIVGIGFHLKDTGTASNYETIWRISDDIPENFSLGGRKR